MASLRRRFVVLPVVAAMLATSGCGGEATAEGPTPSSSATGAATSAAASPSAATGALPAFTGDPVAHATATIKMFETGAAKDTVKTRSLQVVLVAGTKDCAAKDKPFSGTDPKSTPLELCVQDNPFTIAVSAASYPAFVTNTPHDTAGLLLQRWAIGVTELNAENRNLLAGGCVAGATLNGLKDVLSRAEFDAIAAWSNNLRGDYALGFSSAQRGGWQLCKTLNIVR